MVAYPHNKAERDRWIVSRRGERNALDPKQPYGFFVEGESDGSGGVVPVATLLLTNRECPWKCLMCDLWKNTLTGTVASGVIAGQIRLALSQIGPACQIKLYNSGSFFDPGAVPPEDFHAVAELLRDFDRVIVECHPALVGSSVLRFGKLLRGRLEVAMGLETANPDVLEKLNKNMTLELFASAADWLAENDVDVRTFILLQPPFQLPQEALFWAKRSIAFAFEHHARVASLIPTRGGNGAIETLHAAGLFRAPALQTLEASLEYGLRLQKGLVFADLWDLRQAPETCTACFEERKSRLEIINRTQQISPAVVCVSCGSGRC